MGSIDNQGAFTFIGNRVKRGFRKYTPAQHPNSDDNGDDNFNSARI